MNDLRNQESELDALIHVIRFVPDRQIGESINIGVIGLAQGDAFCAWLKHPEWTDQIFGERTSSRIKAIQSGLDRKIKKLPAEGILKTADLVPDAGLSIDFSPAMPTSSARLRRDVVEAAARYLRESEDADDHIEDVEPAGLFSRIADMFRTPVDEESGEPPRRSGTPAKSNPVLLRRQVTCLNDALEAANDLFRGQPSILNLTAAEAHEQNRIEDFLAGVCYTNEATLEPVGPGIFLIYPTAMVVAAPAEISKDKARRAPNKSEERVPTK